MGEPERELSPVGGKDLVAVIEGPCKPFPVEALTEIGARRAEYLPAMLRLMQQAVDDPAGVSARSDYHGHVFALYLLAEWREKAAFQTILKAFSHHGETTHDLWGDVIHDLGKIIVSTFDGDLDALITYMRDAENDEYARINVFYGLSSLYLFGPLPRDRFLAITRSLLAEFDSGKTYTSADLTWFTGVVAGCSRLHVPELEPEVRRLFDHGMVDPMWLKFKHFQEGAASPAREEKTRTDHQYTPVTSAVEELKHWACFRDPARDVATKQPKLSPKAYNKALKAFAASQEPPHPSPPPSLEKFPGAGRNDPCPCGSGKKYKKCCLG